jgi:hypothetical protein
MTVYFKCLIGRWWKREKIGCDHIKGAIGRKTDIKYLRRVLSKQKTKDIVVFDRNFELRSRICL